MVDCEPFSNQCLGKFVQKVCYASSSGPCLLLPVLSLHTADSIVLGGPKEKETSDRHSFKNRFNENCKESDNKILQPTKIFLLTKPQIIQT